MYFRKKNYKELGGAEVAPILAGIPDAHDIFGVAENKPKTFSLRSKMPKVGTQLNSDCVGWSGAYLKEFLEMEEEKRYTDLSGQFIYAMAKKVDGYSEKGTYISMSTYIPTKYGVCEEDMYREQDIKDDPKMPEPTSFAKENALKYKSKESVFVDRGLQETMQGITDALWTLKLPVVVGAEWFTWNSKTGEVYMPKGTPRFGHATAITGYDEESRTIEFLNSWGKDWGDDGYGYFPYGYPLFASCYTAVDLPNDWQKPKEEVIANRDLEKEQRNAILLKEMIYRSFAKHDRVRVLAAKFWFKLVNALTYKNYSLTDIRHYLYGLDRHGKELFNLNDERK